jgi:hypothetical protein
MLASTTTKDSIMTVLGRQVAGLLLVAGGLVAATSATVMLVQPILAPQEVPDVVQAAPSPTPGMRSAPPPATRDRQTTPPAESPGPDQGTEHDQTDVLDQVIVPNGTSVLDEAVMSGDQPVRSGDTPQPPSGDAPAPPPDPGPDEAADTARPTEVPTNDDPADDARGTPEAPADAAIHLQRPAAPDPRATAQHSGDPDPAARPDRGRPVFPAGWPWHERLGNQGNGKGWGPPSWSD